MSHSVERQLVHVVHEVAEAHERGALVLRHERADAARVSTSARIQQTAELVVGNLIGVTARLAQVLLHVDGELELHLDDGDEDLLRHVALLVALSA